MTFKARQWRRSAPSLAPLALTGPALAQTNSLVDISVVNRDTGETLRTWHHQGRIYGAGNPGTRYSLRFTSHTGERVLAVVSVVGVNIITGETANYNERGYAQSMANRRRERLAQERNHNRRLPVCPSQRVLRGANRPSGRCRRHRDGRI
jgi:hypothetical protein